MERASRHRSRSRRSVSTRHTMSVRRTTSSRNAPSSTPASSSRRQDPANDPDKDSPPRPHTSSNEILQRQKQDIIDLAEDLYAQHASPQAYMTGDARASEYRSVQAGPLSWKTWAWLLLMEDRGGRDEEETILLATRLCDDEAQAVRELKGRVEDLLRFKREVEADKKEVEDIVEDEEEWINWEYLKFGALKSRSGESGRGT